MTEGRKKLLRQKLMAARSTLHMFHGAFAFPLWDMTYIATKDVFRISTNGTCIFLNGEWLQKLSQSSLQFILAHQLMHIALGHIDRPQYYKGDRFHLSCDIIANSYLKEMGWNQEKLSGIGKLYSETFFPRMEGRGLTPQEAMACVPFDPATLKPGQRNRYMIDSEEWWDRKAVALEQSVILLEPGEDFPGAFIDGQEIPKLPRMDWNQEVKEIEPDRVDVKTDKTEGETPRFLHNVWNLESRAALQNLRDQRERQNAAGIQAEFRERIWEKAQKATLHWRQLLHRFVQTEVCDYSFLPPDRRLQDTEFFMPDYNDKRETPLKVWFMVDTSASVTDEMLAVVYGELCNALSQLGQSMEAHLGFFDVRVYEPLPFSDFQDLAAIRPIGGGGTDFFCIFDFLEDRNETPDSLVIFTDGQAEFPEEPTGVPVLWLFTDRNATAPWGSAAFVSITK